jgi:uncharacterized protein YbbK (DUF523 family)
MNRPDAHRKIPIGISSCLLGEQVRYDGGHRHNSLITTELCGIFEFRSLCPEVAIGLGVPREPIQLVSTAQGIRVRGVHKPELDVTRKLQAYGQQVAGGYTDICGYIFKARSPSCGTRGVATWTEQGDEDGPNGIGAYAAALISAIPGLPITDEEDLQDPVQRRHFIAEVTGWYQKNHAARPG